jgi:membrane-bound ClpP family serine protease
VLVGGERWKAVADRPIEVGQSVEITAIDGLTLTVAARDAPAATGPAQETPD